jgi:hypothetical protein
VWRLREQVSLLLGAGHPDAPLYPVGMVSDEADLVAQRANVAEATRAVLLQMAVSSVLSKQADEQFQEVIKRLVRE